jgi:hypothetical protein
VGGFTFLDVAAVRRLAGVTPSSIALQNAQTPQALRWKRLVGIGTSYLESDPNGAVDGLDLLTGDLLLTIGQPPHTAAMISGPGVNTEKVRAALVRLGAKPGPVAGQAGLVWGREGYDHIQAADQFGVGPSLGQFDRTILSGNRVIAARYSAEAGALVGGGGRTLGQEPAIAATITSLGDVVGAVGVGSESSGSLSELAAGVRRPSSAGAVTEVLCAVPSPSAVGATERVIRSRLALSAPPFKGLRMSAVASRSVIDAGTTAGRRWIRATVTDVPSDSPGFLIDLIEHRYLAP